MREIGDNIDRVIRNNLVDSSSPMAETLYKAINFQSVLQHLIERSKGEVTVMAK